MPAVRTCLRSLSLGALLVCCAPLVVAQSAPAAAAGPDDRPIAVLLSEQKWPEALAAIDRLLKTRPTDTQLLMNRGAVLSNLNRNADALATFERVARLNPQLPAAHNNIAVILAATGRYDEARAALERAIKAQPTYATAYENLGDLYAHQAYEAYRQALNLDKTMRSAKTKLDMTQQLIVVATGAPPQERAPAAAAAAPAPLPTAAPAAGTGAAPQPAQGPAAAAASGPARAEVEAAVRGWASAWSRRDAEAFTGAYATDFQGGGADAASWRRDTQARLEARSRITVTLSDLEISVEGDRATARFLQTYESDQPGSRLRTRKTLGLQKQQNRWVIVDEQRR
ncbi:MAG: tetratricopeptide repeat protein [Rubrivivax sp.]|nr:tetratricopeptide repeat protein [Rubrivivax sp.]